MCTAISFVHNHHYFGRNLDLNYDLPLSVVFVPQNYSFLFRKEETRKKHYALYGRGRVKDDYPLFFDAVNEKGLTFAGLNFPGFAYFFPIKKDNKNLAPYELPLYLLGKCSSVDEAKKELKNLSLCDLPFSKDRPVSPLHFYLSDKSGCIVIEQTKEGRKVYDNPFRVLTNNPPFPYHRFNRNNYRNVTAKEPVNRFSSRLPLSAYGKAMGAIGLPGDSSPSSRFVKASFLLENTIKYGQEGKKRSKQDEEKNVSLSFHLLNSVSTLKGESVRDDGSYEYTIYSSIYSVDEQKLFVKTYEDSQIQCYSLQKENLVGDKLLSYKISQKEHFAKIG